MPQRSLATSRNRLSGVGGGSARQASLSPASLWICHPRLARQMSHHLVVDEGIDVGPAHAAIARPQHRLVEQLSAHSAAAPGAVDADRELDGAVVRRGDVRRADDPQVVVDLHDDPIGPRVELPDVLADAGVVDDEAEAQAPILRVEAKEVVPVLRQFGRGECANAAHHHENTDMSALQKTQVKKLQNCQDIRLMLE